MLDGKAQPDVGGVENDGVKFNFAAGAAMVAWGLALSEWCGMGVPGGTLKGNDDKASNAIFATASLEERGGSTRGRGGAGVGGGGNGTRRMVEGVGGVDRDTSTGGDGSGRRDVRGPRLARWWQRVRWWG